MTAARNASDAERAGEASRATVELLGDVVETYLTIGPDDRAALRRQVEAEGEDIMALKTAELSWRSRVDLEVTLRTRREDIRKAVEVRFGRVSPEVDAIIGEATTEEELNALFERALRARTENDLLRPTRQRPRMQETRLLLSHCPCGAGRITSHAAMSTSIDGDRLLTATDEKRTRDI